VAGCGIFGDIAVMSRARPGWNDVAGRDSDMGPELKVRVGAS